MRVGECAVADDLTAEARRRLHAAIVNHLERCPQAGDTVEGILRRWLDPRLTGEAVRVIDDVLDAMVAEGELVAQQLPDGRLFYRGSHRH
jgi:hypothetical protein